MLTTFTCIHKETKEKIKYDDYKKPPTKRRRNTMFIRKCRCSGCSMSPRPTCRRLDRSYGSSWKERTGKGSKNGEYFSFGPVDAMIKDNLWICPIKPTHQNEAYYSITKNEIVVPEKEQFRDGESFYGTLFHEMVHSTGAEGVLDRLQPTLRFERVCPRGTGGRTGQRVGRTTLRHESI